MGRGRAVGGARHHEPPEVAWLPPELEAGAEPELKPFELELELEPEDDVPELVEPEFVEPELVPVEPEPELVPVEPEPEFERDDPEPVEDELEPVEDVPESAEVLVVCVDPGSASATAPATTTLAMPTAVVVDRTLARPWSLAAIARRIPSRFALFMYPSLWSRTRGSLDEPSRLPMSSFPCSSSSSSPCSSSPCSSSRVAVPHEGDLKANSAFRMASPVSWRCARVR